MVEALSSGYCLWETTVQDYGGDRAAVPRQDYEEISAEVYEEIPEDPEGVYVEPPLVVKVDQTYFPAFADGDLPEGRLAVPGPLADDLEVRRLPVERGVLIARGGVAKRLVNWTGMQVR